VRLAYSWALWIDEQGDGRFCRDNRVQHLKPFWPCFPSHVCHAGEIAARAGEAGDKSSCDWVDCYREHDRDRRSRCLGGERCRSAADRGNHCHLTINQIGRQCGQSIVAVLVSGRDDQNGQKSRRISNVVLVRLPSLEGGVRKAGNRLRITTQLVEAETGAHLWADKFDGSLEDVFDLQDQITDRVVGIVEPSLRRSEVERSRRKHPENLGAYDLYLRALPYMVSVMPADARIAAGFLDDALKLDPNYIAAKAFRAWCHEICFTTEPGFVEAERNAGVHHARAVIASSTDDATALAIAALPMLHLAKDHEAALSTIERALSLNASCATALYMGAHVHAFRGNSAVATAYAERALRLSPFDPLLYEAHLALALASLQTERYDEAASRLAKAVQANSGFSTLYFFCAMVLGLAGRADEAAPIARRGLELEPGFRSRVIFEFGLVPAILDKLVEGARKLGLPE